MSPPAAIFHITSKELWARGKSSGSYRHPSLDAEGFIHCSTEAQLHATWQRHFNGEAGLLVLEIRPERLTSRLAWEPGEPGELFPHVYGPIDLDAVTAARELREEGS